MMEVLVSHLLLSVLFGASGLCAGWWLHSRLPDQRSFVGMNDEGLIRELLASLHGLSTRMAVDVNEHTTEMDAVDRELKQVQGHGAETAVVNELVGRLLSANQSVQTKLTETEGKLDELSHKMEHHASEARIDMLTGLANRRAFQEQLHRSLSRFYEAEEPFALVMIDIDRFKQVNDVHGHPFGDEVLRHVGEILLDQCRGCDLVSRYGGEEFAIIMPATRLGEAREMAEELRETVATTGFTCSDISLNLTVSVGAAEILPNEDVSGVMNRVDQAMYAAKHAGRNRSYWHDGMLSHPFSASLNESASERNAEVGEGRAATGSAGPAPPRDAETVSPVEPEAFPQAESETAGEENADGQPSQATDDNVELLHNFCNKTMFCQDLRRRIAEFDAGGVSFSCILVRMD
ncbi:MAG: GGDEF domain-containing protein, partial [Planctomycetota bacterium]